MAVPAAIASDPSFSPRGAAALRAEAWASLEHILLAGLQTVSGGLACLYLVLGCAKPFILSPTGVSFLHSSVAGLTGLELGMAAGFYVLHRVLRRQRIAARSAHRLGAAMLAVLLVDSVLHMVSLPRPLETVSFILLALGVAFYFFSRPWYIAAQAGVVLAWGLGVWLSPAPSIPSPASPWADLGLFLLEAQVLGALIFSSRVRTQLRLETLRIHEERLIQQLEAANEELEAFSYTVSHDLRTPLRGIDGLSVALLEDYGELLPDEGKDYVRGLRDGVQRLGQLIDDLLRLSRVSRVEMTPVEVDLSALVRSLCAELARQEGARDVEVVVTDGLSARADPRLLSLALQNLLANAWKYTSKVPHPRVEFGRTEIDGERVFFVADNGAGFDMAHAHRLFQPFSRLHSQEEFSGNGIGLATVQRIVRRHGGRVWAEGWPGQGSIFLFTL